MWRLAHVPEDGVEHVTGRYGREEVLVYDAEQEPEPYAPPHRYVSPLLTNTFHINVFKCVCFSLPGLPYTKAKKNLSLLVKLIKF